jgi:hypothetical protein
MTPFRRRTNPPLIEVASFGQDRTQFLPWPDPADSLFDVGWAAS